jgi:hypothetical protein
MTRMITGGWRSQKLIVFPEVCSGMFCLFHAIKAGYPVFL